MNIEIANRLVNLRKQNNLSQEALAEKLGISRQAVSKWERAEASPDTDNLILLARLYKISLDELLKTEDEIPEASYIEDEETDLAVNHSSQPEEKGQGDTGEYVHIGFNGIHVKDKDEEVHIGWNGIHVEDGKKGDNVHIDKNGVYVNGEKRDGKWLWYHNNFPMFFFILVVYFIIGCFWNAWHPGWLLFLLVPIWHSLVEAIRRKNALCFAYPILAVLIYLCLGFFGFLWHPGWVIFLTIPLYYPMVNYLQGFGKRETGEWEEEAGETDEEQ